MNKYKQITNKRFDLICGHYRC